MKLIKGKKHPPQEFINSQDYWKTRYEKGGNSGAGSYNKLAQFKGEIINGFVLKNGIKTVIELGFGDGNQLEYFQFPSYIGFDISDTVIQKCRKKFKADASKQFMHNSEISDQKADLVMSLDVIYHLIEDEVYNEYMNNLFEMSSKYVIIYAFDSDDSGSFDTHVKPRKFTRWIDSNKPGFKLIEHIPNRYPFDKNRPTKTSFADFYMYEKIT